MPYEIIRQDITKMAVDAIVNPTDYMYSGSGGTDARIHFAAGPELRAACDALPFLKEGEVAVTEGFRLPCKYIIHTYGPVWQGGLFDEHKKLASCYRNRICIIMRYEQKSERQLVTNNSKRKRPEN
ncbi:MAG: macro domain-containing protein [Clostridia bacterium]|nr:macro domain-containing protein [Clostridia bacterium]